MASTIRTCSYSPQLGEPLTTLQDRQIRLLNRNGAQDISTRVGRLVSKHLGYKGNQVFQAEITKTKITFTVPGETRVLEYTSNKWQLTHSGPTTLSATTDLPVTVQSEVTADIEDTLNRIRDAANFSDDSSSSSPPVPSSPVLHEPSSAVTQINERLRTIEHRLDQLILHLSNPTPRHDSSPDIAAALLTIQRELQGLREAVQRLTRPDSEIASVAGRIKELEEQLRQAEKILEKTKSTLEVQSEKDKQKIKELETQLAQTGTTLEAARKEHEEAQTKGASQLSALQAKLSATQEQFAKTVAALEAANAAQQVLRESNEALQRQLSEAQENQRRLEQARTAASAESLKIKDENAELLAQIKTVSAAKAELEERLKALTTTASASQTELSRKTSELEAQIRTQVEALRAAEGKLTANQALTQRQTEQLEALKASLAAEKEKIAGLEKEKEQQTQQIAKLIAEKAAIQNQLAEQQERVRTITQEKTRVETLLQQARATIEKQNQELEQLRKQLEEMKAEKAKQLKISKIRAIQERAATAAAELEVETLLTSLPHRNRTPVNSSASKVALL